ncbi:MAG: DUF2812 domain-containing protein [Clostridia bacterium]|nr:DUF2812 domain-containing protein [Clostridia bacterium]
MTHQYRIIPCPAYDIAGTEEWLSSLAEKGLHLLHDGIFAGIAAFDVGEPQKIKYRLEAAGKNTGILSDDGGEPDPEQVELGKKYSWEYTAKRGDFYIFRTQDPTARELNTDPAVEALALNTVKKRLRDSLITSILLFLVYPILLTRGCLILTAIAMGSAWMFLALLFAVLCIADDIRAVRYLHRIRKSLQENGYYGTASEGGFRYLFRKCIKTVLGIFLVFTLLRAWGVSVTNEQKILLSEYTAPLPFATLTDFAGEGYTDYQETMTGLGMGVTAVEEKTDFLAPRCILYNEHAEMITAWGKRLDGGLYVDYYELQSPALAKLLEGELYRLDRRKKGFEPMTAPDLAADSVIAYHNELHFPTILIRRGNIVLRAYFFQTGPDEPVPFEDWAKIMCDSVSE